MYSSWAADAGLSWAFEADEMAMLLMRAEAAALLVGMTNLSAKK